MARQKPQEGDSALTARIEQLRQWRGNRDDFSIRSAVAGFTKKTKRDYKKTCQCAEIWEKSVPPELAEHAALVALRAGVLTVSVPSSSLLYLLDRELREGAIGNFERSGVVHRVKLRIGMPKEVPPPDHAIPPDRYALLEDWELPGGEFK